MAEIVTVEKALDGANVWISDDPANVRMEVLWHKESADGLVRTVEGPRVLWEVEEGGAPGALAASFNPALLPASPTLADVMRVLRDNYILPAI